MHESISIAGDAAGSAPVNLRLMWNPQLNSFANAALYKVTAMQQRFAELDRIAALHTTK